MLIWFTIDHGSHNTYNQCKVTCTSISNSWNLSYKWFTCSVGTTYQVATVSPDFSLPWFVQRSVLDAEIPRSLASSPLS